MRKRQVVITLLGLLVAGAASSQGGSGSATLTWIPATVYTDGSAMQLGSQRLFRQRTNEAACSAPPQVFDPLATVSAGIATYVDSALWNGTYYYTAVSVDIFGNTSVNSNVVCKRVSLPGNFEPPAPGIVPNPPGNLQVL